MGRISERHCLLCLHGGMIDKAPACTKRDLRSLVDGLYHDAVGETGYQVAALLEQGLSLFPDKDSFTTCPINAVAMALAMQIFPSASLLNLTLSSTSDDTNLAISIDQTPLVDVLLHFVDDSNHENLESAAPTRRRRATRGAQHANGDPTLSAQWIFDRGNWSMTATSKAFAYLFNTTTEDRKVSKVLSNWKFNDQPKIPSLKEFDSVSKARIRQVGCKLFASSIGFEDKSLSIIGRVINLLAATLIQHFPVVNDRYLMSPYASRMRTCLVSAGIKMPDIAAWSLVINRLLSADGAKSSADEKPFTRELQFVNQQIIVIAQLVEDNLQLRSRIAALEICDDAMCMGSEVATTQEVGPTQDESKTPSSKGRVQAGTKSAASNWYEWYTSSPPLWEVCANRQYKSQLKQIVCIMKLFLP
ncbi:unnamed protein product [Phytophthora fragariaefolia]|uniref:Unnamed protein product n=1 Tax=Phytophthora fragariaefolia TaxID=1490495 RepID=A0A9W6Y5Q3_9STRA|nr:unnamed protein product [Phytophthora fragariaefolia]